MSEKLERITELHQAIKDVEERQKATYNRTIHITSRIVGNALEVSYSTLVNLFAIPGRIPQNNMEAAQIRETVIHRAVDHARQAVASVYIPEVKKHLVNGEFNFEIMPTTEKWHCDPVRSSYQSSTVHFRYKVYFKF